MKRGTKKSGFQDTKVSSSGQLFGLLLGNEEFVAFQTQRRLFMEMTINEGSSIYEALKD